MKIIELTQGHQTIVSDEDYEWLNQWKWYACDVGNGRHYVVRHPHKSKGETGPHNIYMHRMILGITDSKVKGDHIDGNRFNNQRNNLREATSSQNNINRGSIGKCPYKGVSYYRAGRKHYVAKVKVKGKTKVLGYYKTLEEAALVYNKAAAEYYGEYARLNKIIGD